MGIYIKGAMVEHHSKVLGLSLLLLMCGVCLFSPSVCVGFLQVLLLPPTTQKPACYIKC